MEVTKNIFFIILFLGTQFIWGQKISSVQLFNPQTNDQTPVIRMGEQLILKFDDLTNGSHIYRYTLKHYNRNWEDDGLFFTEFAKGSLNGLINQFQYSFNTLQQYTHYSLTFPNEKIQPIISGNFEIIVYKDSPKKPLFTKRFCIVEDGAQLNVQASRFIDSKNPYFNQRVEVEAFSNQQSVLSNVSSISVSILQNNNWNSILNSIKPSTTLGNKLYFQQLNIVFPGNNEFFYFDNKNIRLSADRVAGGEIIDGQNHTYLHPVWAQPELYQFQPDVNGAFYFRRNDAGVERIADREGDYSWVYFSLDSYEIDKELFVLGAFNDYIPSEEYKMYYDAEKQQYIAKIYLKQGFYNYIIATRDQSGFLNLGEINGNFWQTENLYQVFLYYQPFGRNYDGIIGYGEYRSSLQ